MANRTVLYDIQKNAGGKMVDFHGWDMPVQFIGITAEHNAVRTSCGVFDLNHMGRLSCAGAQAHAFLSRQVCRSLAGIKPGQVRYGMVLADDGTIEDDVLVSCESPTSFHIVVNASNREKVLALWRPDAERMGLALRDLSLEQAMLAVQGPKAADLLAHLGLDGRSLRYYTFTDVAWQGCTVRLSRTGYTGEDGFECFLPVERAVDLWKKVHDGGATASGLGARDTLRLEAGMPLYGNELDRSITPVEAGLEFAVNKQGGFIGAPRVLEQLAKGPHKRLVGLKMKDKRVPRNHYPVLAGGKAIGHITSGTLSPTLDQPIGMAYVDVAHSAPGTAVDVDIRGSVCPAEVVALPFYKRAIA